MLFYLGAFTQLPRCSPVSYWYSSPYSKPFMDAFLLLLSQLTVQWALRPLNEKTKKQVLGLIKVVLKKTDPSQSPSHQGMMALQQLKNLFVSTAPLKTIFVASIKRSSPTLGFCYRSLHPSIDSFIHSSNVWVWSMNQVDFCFVFILQAGVQFLVSFFTLATQQGCPVVFLFFSVERVGKWIDVDHSMLG